MRRRWGRRGHRGRRAVGEGTVRCCAVLCGAVPCRGQWARGGRPLASSTRALPCLALTHDLWQNRRSAEACFCPWAHPCTASHRPTSHKCQAFSHCDAAHFRRRPAIGLPAKLARRPPARPHVRPPPNTRQHPHPPARRPKRDAVDPIRHSVAVAIAHRHRPSPSPSHSHCLLPARPQHQALGKVPPRGALDAWPVRWPWPGPGAEAGPGPGAVRRLAASHQAMDAIVRRQRFSRLRRELQKRMHLHLRLHLHGHAHHTSHTSHTCSLDTPDPILRLLVKASRLYYDTYMRLSILAPPTSHLLSPALLRCQLSAIIPRLPSSWSGRVRVARLISKHVGALPSPRFGRRRFAGPAHAHCPSLQNPRVMRRLRVIIITVTARDPSCLHAYLSCVVNTKQMVPGTQTADMPACPPMSAPTRPPRARRRSRHRLSLTGASHGRRKPHSCCIT